MRLPYGLVKIDLEKVYLIIIMYSIYIAHFQDCSMHFTHYYPGRPYDHFIDQVPGKLARELPVRHVA